MVRYWPQRFLCIVCLCGFVFASTPGVWLDVPFFRQEKDGCGAASIAMVMQYWLKQQNRTANRAADPVEIQRALYSSKEHGIRASDLERYFQQHGFRTFSFTGKWEDLKQHLEKGRPLIVALKPSTLDIQLHYVVVVGVDPAQNIVYMNDAAQRKLLKQERADFEKQWSGTGQWTLLALPK
ncbi:MAG: C39 family peptidase [Acidobacteriia bacterium]|nr:C39 family peptidase [Terriglobia bacterium]